MSNIPVQIRLPVAECDSLDNYRREQKNPPSRAQAVRELIRQALSGRQNADAPAEAV